MFNYIQVSKVVENAFKEYYDKKEYSLCNIGLSQNSISYIIIDNDDRSVLVEFYVSDTRIFEARSHGNLLALKHEITKWYSFFTEVNKNLEIKYAL